MKNIVLLGIMLLLMPLALADYGHMMGYGMSGSYIWGFYAIIWFSLLAFIFSVIFWYSYKWIVKQKKSK